MSTALVWLTVLAGVFTLAGTATVAVNYYRGAQLVHQIKQLIAEETAEIRTRSRDGLCTDPSHPRNQRPPVYAKGLCQAHYRAARRAGELP